jgi:two-component system, OmpR family, osmolarity sensor histidine kinase EnvZ
MKSSSLYTRFFWLQLAIVVLIGVIITSFYALNQTRTAMDNMASIFAPALKEALERDSQAGEEVITVSRDVEVVYGVPPEGSYAPNRTHLRWQALQESLEDRGIVVKDLLVSGVSGDATVWIAGDKPATRWVGLRTNMEGTDFRWRWMGAFALSLLLIATGAAWLAWRIGGPMRALERAVDAFSKGKPFVLPARDGSREVRMLIDAFERMARERSDLDEQRALMLAGISHDVRSPLARIRMAAELLPDDAQTSALADRIARNVAIADNLIESFSDYVRADSEPTDTIVDVAAVASEMAHAVGLSAGALRAEGACLVRGNLRLLQRAFANLIENALKHGKPPVTVEVRADRSKQSVSICVTDCGDGIRELDKARLLRPFERGAADRGTPGSGLGLAIVVRIAQRHGGYFEFGPSDRGAWCVMVLPMLASDDDREFAGHERVRA